MVTSHISVQVFPHTLDSIVIGAVWRLEVQTQSQAVFGGQTDFHLLCRVNRKVVQNHMNHFRIRVVLDKFSEKLNEQQGVLLLTFHPDQGIGP
jgi:hypothetical protein